MISVVSIASSETLIVYIGSFLPVTLEQLARERGVLWSDKTTPCVAKVQDSADLRMRSQILMRAIAGKDNNQCAIRPFGTEVTTASFAMYTFSVAVLVQALSLISFSSFADHGKLVH